MTNPVPILLVEDNEIDVEIVERTFRKASIVNPIFKARDGVEAYDILSGKSSVEMVLPCVMLIDINMPRMDGFDLLEKIRGDRDLKNNVAFMLTTSNRQEDISRAYDLNVAGYLMKDDINRIGEFLGDYLEVSHFPVD
ncbi:MAG: response regulator [Rhodospirillales bacterium]|nr:response regulator [Rhodospirillales bacterium]